MLRYYFQPEDAETDEEAVHRGRNLHVYAAITSQWEYQLPRGEESI
jgi:hypothetical protein